MWFMHQYNETQNEKMKRKMKRKFQFDRTSFSFLIYSCQRGTGS